MKFNIVRENDEPTSVVLIHKGKPYVASKEHPNFNEIVVALEQYRPTEAVDMFSPTSAVARGFRVAAKLLRAVVRGRKVKADLDELDQIASDLEQAPARDDDTPDEILVMFDEPPAPPQEPQGIPPIGPLLASVPIEHDDDEDYVPELSPELVLAIREAIEAGMLAAIGEGNTTPDNLVASVSEFLGGGKLHPDITSAVHEGVLAGIGEIDSQDVETLADIAEKVEVRKEGIFYDGEKVDGALADTIMHYYKQGGRDFTPLVKMMAKIQENPGEESRQHLYIWLKHLDFTIDSDGDIIAYKVVRSDMTSDHAGEGIVNGVYYKYANLDNSVGNVVEMPRDSVNPNRYVACSTGLHVGTMNYLSWFGGSSRARTLIEIKVNPRDVVSVPSDEHNRKMRVCKYKVIRKLDSVQEARTYSGDEKRIELKVA